MLIKTKVGKKFNSPTLVETKMLIQTHCAVNATKIIAISLNVQTLDLSILEIAVMGTC
jgi:hypothetical protein